MKKYSILILTLFLIVNKNVKGQWSYSDKTVSVTYTYEINSNKGDTILNTSLTISDLVIQKTYNLGNFVFKMNNIRNKDSISNILSTQYQILKNQYGLSELINISSSVEKLLTQQVNILQQDQLRTLIYQALGIYNSLIKGSLRDHGSGVIFTPSDSYIVGINTFSCEEEQLINVIDFINYLTIQKPIHPNDPGYDYFLNALQNEARSVLNIKELNAKVADYFNSSTGRWPQGGQCGCCGNYSGPCIYWSTICLIHDYQCQSCSPRWYCGPTCVASSCSGNTISWYWFT